MFNRGWRAAFAAVSLSLLGMAVCRPAPAQGAVAPAIGFDPQVDQVDELLSTIGPEYVHAVAGAWLDSGRLLVLGQFGHIYVTNVASHETTLVAELGSRVFADGEKGSLDLAVDPGVATNNFFYVYYAHSADGQHNDDLRVSRFTLGTPSIEATETVIWSRPATESAASYHVGGSLNVGPDAKLYLTIGDGRDDPAQPVTDEHAWQGTALQSRWVDPR